MGATIEVKNLNRIFRVGMQQFQALTDINVSIPADHFAILRGRSGSGKTTLMNQIGALDTPTSGEILLDGRNLLELSERKREDLRRKEFGFVFQSVSLIPTMTAFQNVEFAMRMAGIRGDYRPRVEETLKMVGLGSRMNHMPAEMSGGEQQRVAIARGIAHHPSILLADEPTAELDSAMAAEVTRILKEMTRREHVTVLMTTHDVGLMDAGDLVIELQGGKVLGITENPRE
ncbi:MAG: ABC transporter ATP-binding protein [Lachnospiraceae bacterium]|jgi:putative ABC transport system ATP-binding protein|nr:ABC transporter ATP-binding protein [Lachnospiraceae bacterium]MCR5425731.1 ABC transporter ATP-binding protein [Lachnospiraceae bacterium]